MNVGWLEPGQEFPRGGTSPEFRNRLAWCCAHQVVNLTRGVHRCRLCRRDPGQHYIRWGREEYFLGASEIRVAGVNAVYAAPNLIIHYVVDHNYAPPADFVYAVSREGGTFADGRWTIKRRRHGGRGGPWWQFW